MVKRVFPFKTVHRQLLVTSSNCLLRVDSSTSRLKERILGSAVEHVELAAPDVLRVFVSQRDGSRKEHEFHVVDGRASSMLSSMRYALR